MLSDSIQPQISAALTQAFTTGLASDDALSIKVVRVWPLQDDPTQVAPYITFSEHPQLGETLDPMFAEVGGGTYRITHWRAVFGTPRASTREQADSDIYTLRARVEAVISAHYNLNDLIAAGPLRSPGGACSVEGNSPYEVLVQSAARKFGGNGQFYGEGMIIWRYRFRVARNW